MNFIIDEQLLRQTLNYIASIPSGTHPVKVPLDLLNALQRLDPAPDKKTKAEAVVKSTQEIPE